MKIVFLFKNEIHYMQYSFKNLTFNKRHFLTFCDDSKTYLDKRFPN